MCVACVASPACHGQKKDQPFPGQGPSCHLIEHAQGPQTICAACPLLISSSFQRYPVCSRPHVQKRTCVRPSSLQAEVIVVDHIGPRPLKIPAGLGYFSTPSYPRLSQSQLSRFSAGIRISCCVPGIALTPRLVLLAGGWMRHAALAARTVFAPKTMRRTWNSVWLHEGWRKDTNKGCQIHHAICPTLPVLASLLPGAESRIWTTAAHVKSRIHLTPAAFARVSHSCTRHSRRGGHNMDTRRLSGLKSEFRDGYHACCWTTTAHTHTHADTHTHTRTHTHTHTPLQPVGRIPLTRPMTADALGAHVKPQEELVVKSPHCRLCPVRSVDLSRRFVSLCNPGWSNTRPCLLVEFKQALPSKGRNPLRQKKKVVWPVVHGLSTAQKFPPISGCHPHRCPRDPSPLDGSPSISHT